MNTKAKGLAQGKKQQVYGMECCMTNAVERWSPQAQLYKGEAMQEERERRPNWSAFYTRPGTAGATYRKSREQHASRQAELRNTPTHKE